MVSHGDNHCSNKVMYLTVSLSYVTGVVIVGRFNFYDNLEKKQRILMFFFLISHGCRIAS